MLKNIEEKVSHWTRDYPIRFLIILSLFLNLIIEMLSRCSFTEGILFAMGKPLGFLFGTAIIFCTLSISFLVPRRQFAIIWVSFFWIAMGVVNFILLHFRASPLGAVDFQILPSCLGMFKIYFNTFHFILAFLAIVGLIVAIVLSYRRLPHSRVSIYRGIGIFLSALALVFAIPSFSLDAAEKNSMSADLLNAYDEYGFAYCFSSSLFDRGVREPENYTQSALSKQREILDYAEIGEMKPNIVFVQLESFIDPNTLNNLEFSEDPTPNFNKLKEECSGGVLTVPTIGAGTANVEFEILSGMNLDYFGFTEYPYNTFLQGEACESVAYNLAGHGYYPQAIHNHIATFYKRHIVYSNLGFQRFTSVEYMQDVEYTPLGWAKDKVLTAVILEALKSSPERDFVFAVSTQAHGKYPEEAESTQGVEFSGSLLQTKNGMLQYYLNQIVEVDRMIGDLTQAVADFPEPVVLVFYGDHIPSLGLQDEDFRYGLNRYNTEYVIWSNFPMSKTKKDLEAYQLSAYVLKKLGISGGMINNYHQQFAEQMQKAEYERGLHEIQYDIISGNRYIYDGENPYQTTDLIMGLRKTSTEK